MEDIHFFCPECGGKLKVVSKAAGRSLPCPHCSKTIIVPKEPPLKSVHSGPSSKPQSEDESPQIIACPFCSEQILATAIKCKHCGEFLDGRQSPPPPAKQQPTRRQSYKKKKVEYVGVGALVQLAGFIALFFFFPIGIVAGIILLIIGSRMSIKWTCGLCGNKLESKEVTLCPSCNALLVRK